MANSLSLQPQWLGQIDYIAGVKAVESEASEFAAREALGLQIRRYSVFGLEHPLTITLGKRADPLKDICVGVRVLKEKGVQIVAVDRGGHATLHNNGQLVIYPHLHLPTWRLGVREFVEVLQKCTKSFLNDFGIESFSKASEPGLYTEKGKIAFFGLRIKKGWSSHGLAINVTNDLSDFQLIRSCGQKDQPTCRMADWVNTDLELPQLFARWNGHFEQLLTTMSPRGATTQISDEPSATKSLTTVDDTPILGS